MNKIEVQEPKLYDTLTRIKARNPKPETWEEGARIIVEELAWGNGWYLHLLDSDRIEEYYGKGFWDILARAAYSDVKEDMPVDKMVALLASKQADYGPRNILMFGFAGLKVRLWDKVARYTNLQGQKAENESLFDTMCDIVGYVTITLMLEFGWFNLPLAKDLP